MADERTEAHGESPVVELLVYRHGELDRRELFESEEQARFAMEAWGDLEGVEFRIADLSVHHGAQDILEDEPGEILEEEAYPTALDTGEDEEGASG